MSDMTECIAREFKESDARLNLVYQTLMKSLATPSYLQRAQRAWITFRDEQCAFENEALLGGSAHRFSSMLCLIRLTEHRITQLELVQPCNGCVKFKPEFYGNRRFGFPRRDLTLPEQDAVRRP